MAALPAGLKGVAMNGRTLRYASVVVAKLAIATPAAAQTAPADLAAELKALREEVAALKAEVAELKEQREAPPLAVAATTPPPSALPKPVEQPATQISWKGAPEFKSADGWSFKPRGRIQVDAGYLNAPLSAESPIIGGARYTVALRRAYVGAQGTIPGGFSYRAEIDLAPKTPEWADVYLAYDKGPINVTVGQIYNFLGLEQMTSDLFPTFTERASYTGAFNYKRRLGVAVNYTRKSWMVGAGIFGDSLNDLLPDGSRTLGYDGRLVLMPKFGDLQVHLAGNAHYRHYYPYAETNVTRYRARPYFFSSATRPLETDNLFVLNEVTWGSEAALIFKRLHAAGEAVWLKSSQINDRKQTYHGGYGEIGIFLTPDTRGYHNGQFERTVPKHAVGDGGIGAVEWNLRYDYLDLTDPSSIFAGKEWSVGSSVVWTPTAYVRFVANYIHLRYLYRGFPPDTNVDTGTIRAQIDF
jgi:phosphate-selective porin OprO and OprP